MFELYWLLFLLVTAGLFYIIYLIWRTGRKFWKARDTRQKVSDPNGSSWKTQFHWSKPNFKIGIWDRVFSEKSALPKSVRSKTATPKKANLGKYYSKRRWWRDFSWGDLLPDEIAIPILVAISLIFVSIVFVFLLIELAILFLVTSIFMVLRLTFIHPWKIEAIDPNGQILTFETRGFRKALNLHSDIRNYIQNGQLEIMSRHMPDGVKVVSSSQKIQTT